MRRSTPDDPDDDDIPSAKRARSQSIVKPEPPDDDGDGTSDRGANFRVGSVLRVTLTNFITYDRVSFRPGPRLNVVIGPNGTGKSSIVAALVLGLGADPGVLGKAKDAISFIKMGTDNATIEIELKGERYNTVIRRDINKASRQSTWTLNGKRTTLEDVRSKTHALNIQVGRSVNLVQFLPQERVSDFAAMKPTELLLATEEAVGGLELREMHEKLASKNKTILTQDKDIAQTDKVIQDLQEKNAKLATEVKKFRQRREKEDKLQLMKKKRYWLEFEDARQKGLEAKKEYEDAEKEFKEKQAALPVLENKAKELRKTIENVEKQLAQSVEVLKKMETQRKAYQTKDLSLKGDVENALEEFKQIRARVANRQNEIRKLKKTIAMLKEDLEKLPAKDDAEKEVRVLEKEITVLTKDVGEKETALMEAKERLDTLRREQMQIERQFNDAGNTIQRRLEALRNKSPDTITAYNWVKRNANIFEKPVLGPVAIEINPRDELHARYMEHILGDGWLNAFICQTEKDRDLLAQQNFRGCRSIYTPRVERITHGVAIEKLRPYGITDYADEIFTSPDVVKAALVEINLVNRLVIGRQDFNRNVFNDFPQIMNVLCPVASYSVKRSNYGGGTSTHVAELKKGTILLAGLTGNAPSKQAEMSAELKSRAAEIEKELAQIKAEIDETQADWDKARKVLKDLRDKKGLFQNAEKRRTVTLEKIASTERQLVSIEQIETDVDEEEKRMREVIQELQAKRLENLKKLLDQWQKQSESTRKIDALTIERMHAKHKVGEVDRLLAAKKAETADQAHKVEELLAKSKQLARLAKEKRENAMKHADIESDEQLKEQFASLPVTLNEIDAAMDQLQIEISRIFVGVDDVLVVFENRLREIMRLKTEVESARSHLVRDKEEVKTLEAKWKPRVVEMIQNISKKFGQYMDRINCKGEVDLYDDSPDFGEWGVRIKVAFRQPFDPLLPLDGNEQSGGERSVSTMLYLIALQEFTTCPFRLVDEINQGMDVKNERAVFQQLVEASASPDVPQYFLVTPKLLAGLEYGEDTTVLCVCNGPEQPSEWAQDAISFRRRLSSQVNINE